MPVNEYDWDIISAFQTEYPTKQEKENALRNMTEEEIDVLIKASPSVYGKIFYSHFRKKENNDENEDNTHHKH